MKSTPVLHALTSAGPLTMAQLRTITGISLPTLKRMLQELEVQRLVTSGVLETPSATYFLLTPLGRESSAQRPPAAVALSEEIQRARAKHRAAIHALRAAHARELNTLMAEHLRESARPTGWEGISTGLPVGRAVPGPEHGLGEALGDD